MPSRIIRSHGGSQILLDSLVSLLTLEAMNPSKEIYIISPWLSNSPLTDNRNNKLSTICPFLNTRTVYLSDLLFTYAWRGTKVRLICKPEHKYTHDFLNLMGDKVEYRVLDDNHEKGLFTNMFYLHGSMNFTFYGINVNSECIRVTTEQAEVNAALLAARARWEEAEWS